MHIASLVAHSTLNTYILWELALRGHLNTDARTRDRTRNFFITRTMPYALGHSSTMENGFSTLANKAEYTTMVEKN